MNRTGSRSSGRPTLTEVALQAGVSPITASRALRGVATVAPELVTRVQEAAARLGYVTNPAARALASAQGHSATQSWREAVKTRQPAAWKCLTVAWPMPRLAPVSSRVF